MAAFEPSFPNTGTLRFDGALYFPASGVDFVELDANTPGSIKKGYLHFDTSSIPDGATVLSAFLEYRVVDEPTDNKDISRIDLYQGDDVIGLLDEPPDPDWDLSAFTAASTALPHAVGVLNRIEVDPDLISLVAFSDFAIACEDEDPDIFNPTVFRLDFDQDAFRLIVRHSAEPADNVKNF